MNNCESYFIDFVARATLKKSSRCFVVVDVDLNHIGCFKFIYLRIRFMFAIEMILMRWQTIHYTKKGEPVQYSHAMACTLYFTNGREHSFNILYICDLKHLFFCFLRLISKWQKDSIFSLSMKKSNFFDWKITIK